eukprot:12933693-Prorocentrum_lima.AAC.1
MARNRNDLVINTEGNITTISVELDQETGTLNVLSSRAKQEPTEQDVDPNAVALNDEYEVPDADDIP